jgi:hypothetical protein
VFLKLLSKSVDRRRISGMNAIVEFHLRITTGHHIGGKFIVVTIPAGPSDQ